MQTNFYEPFFHPTLRIAIFWENRGAAVAEEILKKAMNFNVSLCVEKIDELIEIKNIFK